MQASPPKQMVFTPETADSPVRQFLGLPDGDLYPWFAIFIIVCFLGEALRLNKLFSTYLSKSRMEWLPRSTIAAYLALYAFISIVYTLLTVMLFMPYVEDPDGMGVFRIGLLAGLMHVFSKDLLGMLLCILAKQMDGETQEDICNGVKARDLDVEAQIVEEQEEDIDDEVVNEESPLLADGWRVYESLADWDGDF